MSSITEEYKANFSIIHSNLQEFKTMLETLHITTIEGIESLIDSHPSYSKNRLTTYKSDCTKIFLKIFKFLEKFIKTLGDFSSESRNFEKFSEISENSSFHKFPDENIDIATLSLENELLKVDINNCHDKLEKIKRSCLELVKEVKVHKNLSENLKKTLESVLSQRNKQEKSSVFLELPGSERYSKGHPKKIEENIDALKNQNKTLLQDCQKLSIENNHLKHLHEEATKRIQEFENSKRSKPVLKEDDNLPKVPLEKSKYFPKPTKNPETDTKDQINLPKIYTQPAKPEPSVTEELENLKMTLAEISSELEEPDPSSLLQKIKDLKFESHTNYVKAEEDCETLQELEKYTRTSRGKLLSFIQSNTLICKKSCKEFFTFFEEQMTGRESSINDKLLGLKLRIANLANRVSRNFKLS